MQVEKVLEELKKRTEKKVFSLSVNKDKEAGIYDSKFGGVPYWDKLKEYPVDSQGEKLMFLAQINLSQVGEHELLPTTGMLQFFIGQDDLYGCDLDKPDNQDMFSVVYHEELTEGITKEEVLSMDIPTTCNIEGELYSPIEGEIAIDIKESKVSMGVADYRFEGIFREIAAELGTPMEEDESIFDVLEDDEYNECAEINMGHWLLGYPYFTQNDPREYSQELQCYDTLLFQMDSDFGKDRPIEIMWGDAGVGNFFINEDDLRRRDFSKVMYTWDCG